MKVLENFKSAREFLGQDFIRPEQIEEVTGLLYGNEQLGKLATTFPSLQKLKYCADNSIMLIPGPPKSMSLSNLFKLKPRRFQKEDILEYSKEKFANNEKADMGWIALRKAPISASVGRRFLEQVNLLYEPEYVPNAVTIAWCVVMRLELNIKGFPHTAYVRTLSTLRGKVIHIGRGFPRTEIASLPGEKCGGAIGLNSAIRL